MASKSRKRNRPSTSWPEIVIMVLRVLSQVNTILYDWFKGGPGGPAVR
jgi:hypothetical protein